MSWARLSFILDRALTCANVLEKSIAAYGAGFELLRFSANLKPYGVAGSALTLGQLQALVNRLSNALLRAGLQRFDRVAICKRQSVDYLLVSLAVMRAGGITVPINGRMAAPDLRHYLAHTDSRFVFVDDTTADRLDPAALATGVLKAVYISSDAPLLMMPLARFLDNASETFVPIAIGRDEDVMIVHTSGTTGFPKGVLHGSDSIVRATKAQLLIQPFSRRNRLLLATPTNHHITQAAIVTCLAGGVSFYVPGDERGESILTLIAGERSTVVLAFPDLYQELCRAGLERHDLGRVKAWMAAGDSSHEVHVCQLTRHGAYWRLFGRKLVGSLYVEFFGSSEVGFAALLKVSTASTRRYARCVGRRTPFGPRVKVADTQGQPVAHGEVGRLMVKGPTLFKGYWNQNSPLYGVQTDGWWWTGDLVRRDGSGRYYHLDRAVDVIETRDGPVYSLPLEEELLRHPAVADAAVVAVSRGGKACAAAVIEVGPQQHLSPDDAAAWMRGLPAAAGVLPLLLPNGEALPRGLTGKVLKRRLRERFGPEPLCPL